MKESKQTIVNLRVREEEKASWTERASALGLTVSEWLRGLANGGLAGSVAPRAIVAPVKRADSKPDIMAQIDGQKPLAGRWKCKCGRPNYGDNCGYCKAKRITSSQQVE